MNRQTKPTRPLRLDQHTSIHAILCKRQKHVNEICDIPVLCGAKPLENASNTVHIGGSGIANLEDFVVESHKPLTATLDPCSAPIYCNSDSLLRTFCR